MANQGFLTGNIKRFYKMLPLNQCILNTLLFFSILLGGCASTTTFRVLDAETKEPIKGAVALAMWDSARGFPGLSVRYTAKAVEAVTGSDGVFQITGPTGSLARVTPRFKVYKPGYVGWDSKLIYLGCRENDIKRARTKRREGFSMKKNQDIYLEPWKDEFTFISHDGFIDTYTNLRKEAGLENSKYEKAIDYERPFRIKEWNNFDKKRK